MAPFGSPVVPDVKTMNATSSPESSTGDGDRPVLRVTIAQKFSVSAGGARRRPASIDGSGASGSRNSSGEVVIVCVTAVAGTAALPTCSYRSSWQISMRAPAPDRIFTSSRSRSIGLQGTITAPHFQAASTAITTCGMFCM
jgi:hypothetical protein